MLLDSNVLIYFSKPGGEFLARWVGDPRAAVSIVSQIEALGFAGLIPVESEAIELALESLPSRPLTDATAKRAIALRRRKRMKLGDAIIAATALEYGVPLVTRNEDDFENIPGLETTNPFNLRENA